MGAFAWLMKKVSKVFSRSTNALFYIALYREILNEMEMRLNYLERGGTGKGTYWKLNAVLHNRLSASGHFERNARIDLEAAKTRILSVLKQRSEQRKPGLSNAEIRQIVSMNRKQVIRLMKELMKENPSIPHPGRGKYARYCIQKDD